MKKCNYLFFIVGFLGFFLTLISCKKDTSLFPEPKLQEDTLEIHIPSPYDTLDISKKYLIENISYGIDTINKLDICLPSNRRISSTPIIVFIHGGGWAFGDKSFFLSDIQQYADSGFACVSLNYRFADTLTNITYVDLINDIRTAVNFIRTNSAGFRVSSNRIGIIGHSAGGHLALLTSYLLNGDHAIKACSSVSGPTNFIDSIQRAVGWINVYFKNVMGRDLVSTADTISYKAASPYWVVNSNCIPTQLIHGTDDFINIVFNNSVILHQKLDILNVPNSFIPLAGVDHNSWGYSKDSVYTWFKRRL